MVIAICVSSGAHGPFLESGGMDIIHGGSNFFSLDSCFMFPDVSCVCIIFKIKVSMIWKVIK